MILISVVVIQKIIILIGQSVTELKGQRINAFHTKLQRILHVMHPGFGQDITHLKYFHRATQNSINEIDLDSVVI